MNTARRHLAAFVATLMGCGPTTINVTTTSDGEAGEESSTAEMPSGSTGLEGSESGPVDVPSSTGASSGGADSGSTTGGGGSSSSGEPPPVCLAGSVDTDGDGVVDTWTCECNGVATEPQAVGAGCFCGDVATDLAACESGCALVDADDGWGCACDGALADPSECGCPEVGAQDCICAGSPCGPCAPIGALCLCGDFVAPAEVCNLGGQDG